MAAVQLEKSFGKRRVYIILHCNLLHMYLPHVRTYYSINHTTEISWENLWLSKMKLDICLANKAFQVGTTRGINSTFDICLEGTTANVN